MPRDAEAWLAERGIERRPIRATPTTSGPAAGERVPATDDRTGISSREAQLLATAAATESERRRADAEATRPPAADTLGDDVAAGLAFVRRSTANAPQSVGRLRRKLAERGTPAAAIDLIIERAHAERLVDDLAMATALVEERRAQGHAPTRLRNDLVTRGFDRATIDVVLTPVEAEDQEAAAFDVARAKADRLTGLDAETAFRRTVGHVARRGYAEGLARKVARQAVDISRDPARTAGH